MELKTNAVFLSIRIVIIQKHCRVGQVRLNVTWLVIKALVGLICNTSNRDLLGVYTTKACSFKSTGETQTPGVVHRRETSRVAGQDHHRPSQGRPPIHWSITTSSVNVCWHTWREEFSKINVSGPHYTYSTMKYRY